MAYDPLGQRLTRRKFLGYAVKGAASLAAATAFGQFLMACSSDESIVTHVKRIYTIKDVRAGSVEPSIYVSQMSSSMPEIRDAKKDGILKDVMYSPSEEEIRQTTIEAMANMGYDQNVARSSADVALDAYLTVKKGDGDRATILPGVNLLFGAHSPMYMVFLEGFAGNIETDEEFRMTARHELRHIKDFYNGITLGNFDITGTSPGVDSEFITNLGELRATHDTSLAIYRAFKTAGRLPVTPGYFGREMDRYALYWKLVKTGSTSTESMLADLQLVEFSDITPEELVDGTVKMTFNVSGKKESLVVKHAE